MKDKVTHENKSEDRRQRRDGGGGKRDEGRKG